MPKNGAKAGDNSFVVSSASVDAIVVGGVCERDFRR
jgi:hypothetical protein